MCANFHTDVAVVGATPSGIAMAIRMAREGIDTTLVALGDHLGGMMASGLSYSDTMTKKHRAPILTEFVTSIRDHYLSTYGPESRQFERCEDGYVFEPHVAEDTFERLVADEDHLDVLRSYAPVAAERSGEIINTVTFEAIDGNETHLVEAEIFAEASYEGDLLEVVGASYRIGREPRSKYDEQFAGTLFTRTDSDNYYPRAAVGGDNTDAPVDRRGPLDVPAEKRSGELDLLPHPAGLSDIYYGSTGEGGPEIQAYNYRLCLSCDPDNRRRPNQPPGYDREEFLEELSAIERSGLRSYLLLRLLPNDKADMNAADLPGESHEYPLADWDHRCKIAQRHQNYALGLLYFLQNDDAVPEEIRREARKWGLACDEFVDNDNFPWQLYVREGRRLKGRDTFTEGDARKAPGIERTPIKRDAIAIAEYPLDSHACTPERRQNSHPDGHFFASQVTRPSQIPYRSLLPVSVDNLLVPGPLSASHVGYGTIRLEPTWMHVGESAGWAAVLSAKFGIAPAELDVERLQRRLVDEGVLLSFFNSHDAETDEPWLEAVQYWGTKGFFGSYDADVAAPLTAEIADLWIEIARATAKGTLDDPSDRAREVTAASKSANRLTRGEFLDRLATATDRSSLDIERGDDELLSRGKAAEILYEEFA